MKPKAVAIFWLDVVGETGWKSRAEADAVHADSEVPCVSLGFIVKSDRDWVTLWQTNSSDQFHNYIKIPKRWIIETLPLPDWDTLRAMKATRKSRET